MSLMEREEFGIKKIIQELQEAVDLGDAPKRGPFAVFVRKEYLVEAIAKLRDYQALQSSDTSARMAAIKDIPTERVIALAQAEAAGLVSILDSAAEGADAQPNEPLTQEALLEMDGQPVVVVKGNDDPMWALVTVESVTSNFSEFFVHCADGDDLRFDTDGDNNFDGEEVVFYRRPPKEA